MAETAPAFHENDNDESINSLDRDEPAFFTRCLRYLEGDLSASEFEVLRQDLMNSERRMLFVELCRQMGALREVLSSEEHSLLEAPTAAAQLSAAASARAHAGLLQRKSATKRGFKSRMGVYAERGACIRNGKPSLLLWSVFAASVLFFGLVVYSLNLDPEKQDSADAISRSDTAREDQNHNQHQIEQAEAVVEFRQPAELSASNDLTANTPINPSGNADAAATSQKTVVTIDLRESALKTTDSRTAELPLEQSINSADSAARVQMQTEKDLKQEVVRSKSAQVVKSATDDEQENYYEKTDVRIGTIKSVEKYATGPVLIRGSAEIPLQPGLALKMGDRIRAGAIMHGAGPRPLQATLQLDGAIVEIAAHTQLEFKQERSACLSYGQIYALVGSGAALSKGKSEQVQLQQISWQLDTEIARTEAKDASFELDTDPTRTVVRTHEGRIRFEMGNRHYFVGKGQESTARHGAQSPTYPRAVSPDAFWKKPATPNDGEQLNNATLWTKTGRLPVRTGPDILEIGMANRSDKVPLYGGLLHHRTFETAEETAAISTSFNASAAAASEGIELIAYAADKGPDIWIRDNIAIRLSYSAMDPGIRLEITRGPSLQDRVPTLRWLFKGPVHPVSYGTKIDLKLTVGPRAIIAEMNGKTLNKLKREESMGALKFAILARSVNNPGNQPMLLENIRIESLRSDP